MNFSECTFCAPGEIRAVYFCSQQNRATEKLSQGVRSKRTSETPLPSAALKPSSRRFVISVLYRDAMQPEQVTAL